MPRSHFYLFRPLNLGNIRITLYDRRLKILFRLIIVNLPLQVIAERILD